MSSFEEAEYTYELIKLKTKNGVSFVKFVSHESIFWSCMLFYFSIVMLELDVK